MKFGRILIGGFRNMTPTRGSPVKNVHLCTQLILAHHFEGGFFLKPKKFQPVKFGTLVSIGKVCLNT